MKKNRKINQKAYRFYAVYKQGLKIESGWENLTDAHDRIREAVRENSDLDGLLAVYTGQFLRSEEIEPNDNAHWQNFPESHVQARYQAVMESFWWGGYSDRNQAKQDALKAEWQALTKGRKELKAVYTCPP